MGGVFFAFSGFVLGGLARLPYQQGIKAMQSINVTATRPPLMLALFGSALLCAALIVRGWTIANHVRAAASLAALACLVLPLLASHSPRPSAGSEPAAFSS